MLRSVVTSALSFVAIAAMLNACGSSNKAASGFTDTGTDASTANGSGDDSGTSASGGDDDGTNVNDGGLITLNTDSSAAVSGGVDGGCAMGSFTASRSPLYLDIVLDGSGSMADEKKWTTAVSALKSIFSTMESENDDTLGVGLEVFSDSQDSNQPNGYDCLSCSSISGACDDTCSYPTKKDVGLRFVDSTQDGKLNTRLGGSPQNGTPTYGALKGAYSYMSSFTPASPLQADGKKVVVIITDGVPSDNPDDSTNAAKTNAAAGILTFVVGVGPFEVQDGDYDPRFLGALAVAGGTATSGCNPSETKDVTKACYFNISPSSSKDYTQDFINAINEIRGEVSSCNYKLDFADGGTPDLTKVNVVYTAGDGTQSTLVEDPTNGWTFDNATDPTEVILHGTDCASVSSDPKGSVSIVIGCATVTMPGPR